MSSKSKKSASVSTKSAPKTSQRADYLPRAGTLPARIFANLNTRPMLFGELSDCIHKETGLEGDSLASQLSAALYDLCARGVVTRIDARTRKVIPSKNARGALYGLTPKTRALYRANLNGASGGVPSGASATEPRQLDLSRFSPPARALTSTSAGCPARMPADMYAALVAQRAAAEKQVVEINAMLANPIWS